MVREVGNLPIVSKAQPAEKDQFSEKRYSIPGMNPKRVLGVWEPTGVNMVSQVQVLYISTSRIQRSVRGYSAARLKVTLSMARTGGSFELPAVSLKMFMGLFNQMLLYSRKGFTHLNRLTPVVKVKAPVPTESAGPARGKNLGLRWEAWPLGQVTPATAATAGRISPSSSIRYLATVVISPMPA